MPLRMQKNPHLMLIVLLVGFLHFLAIFLFSINKSPVVQKQLNKVIVSTITLSPTIVDVVKPAVPRPTSHSQAPLVFEDKKISEPEILKKEEVKKPPVSNLKKEEPKKDVKKQNLTETINKEKTKQDTPKKPLEKVEKNVKKEAGTPVAKPAEKKQSQVASPSKAIVKTASQPTKQKESKLPIAPPKASATQTQGSKKKEDTQSQPTLTVEQQRLLNSIKEGLTKLENKNFASSSRDAPKVETANLVAGLRVDESPRVLSQKNSAAVEANYRDELVHRLKLLLKLPEQGEVKIQLTIDRDGKIAKLVVLKSESEKNRSYVEKNLPTMTMPTFGDRFKDKSQHTFPITLSNE